jgi:putative ABC transport system substrate-binding protein
MEVEVFEARGPEDFEGAFARWTNERVGAVLVGDHAFLVANSNIIAALTAKYRLPSVGPLELATNGGLIAYGVNFPEMFRRASVFVDKILRGAKPGDIPVEQTTRIELIVNSRTAKTIGIEIPTSILLRADEVID